MVRDPAADAVVVHKVDIDANETPDVSLGEFMTGLEIYLDLLRRL